MSYVLSFFSDSNHIGRRWQCSYRLLKERWPVGKDWIRVSIKRKPDLQRLLRLSTHEEQALLATESLVRDTWPLMSSHISLTQPQVPSGGFLKVKQLGPVRIHSSQQINLSSTSKARI